LLDGVECVDVNSFAKQVATPNVLESGISRPHTDMRHLLNDTDEDVNDGRLYRTDVCTAPEPKLPVPI